MKKDILQLLHCPVCRGNLHSDSPLTAGNVIVDGVVACMRCFAKYPVADEVLELTPPPLHYQNSGADASTPGEDFSAQILQRRHFDEWAAGKSGFIGEFNNQPIIAYSRAKIEKYVCTLLSHRRVGRILDIGCGDGESAINIAKDGYTVVGFEIAKQYIHSAIAKSRAAGVYANTCFLVGDGDNPPIKAEMFDCVLTLGVLHHMPNPKNTCRRIYSILENGGIHIFSENHDSLLRPIFNFMMRRKPLWIEESGESPLMTESKIRSWYEGANYSDEYFYSVFAPPHLANFLGHKAGGLLLKTTDFIGDAIPGIRKLGGIIYGTITKRN